jgi:kinesin family protein 2/24
MYLGSGKTFTMMGSNPLDPNSVEINAGIYVLVARDLFTSLQQQDYGTLKLYLSCFEIYGGKLYDLLNSRSLIKCLEDSKGLVQTPGLTEHVIDNVEELLQLMATGHSQRSTGCSA